MFLVIWYVQQWQLWKYDKYCWWACEKPCFIFQAEVLVNSVANGNADLKETGQIGKAFATAAGKAFCDYYTSKVSWSCIAGSHFKN